MHPIAQDASKLLEQSQRGELVLSPGADRKLLAILEKLRGTPALAEAVTSLLKLALALGQEAKAKKASEAVLKVATATSPWIREQTARANRNEKRQSQIRGASI
jgi:hypothetical protein